MVLNSVIFDSGSSVGAILESINQEKLLLPKMVSAASGILSLQFQKCFSLRGAFTATEVGSKDVVPQK